MNAYNLNVSIPVKMCVIHITKQTFFFYFFLKSPLQLYNKMCFVWTLHIGAFLVEPFSRLCWPIPQSFSTSIVTIKKQHKQAACTCIIVWSIFKKCVLFSLLQLNNFFVVYQSSNYEQNSITLTCDL